MSIACMSYIVIGSWGRNRYDSLPTSTANCPGLNVTTESSLMSLLNTTEAATVQAASLIKKEWSILDMSFTWYIVLGFLITCVVGISLSFALKPASDAKFDPKLLSPIIKRFVKYELTPSEELEEMKVNKQTENIKE